MSAATSIGWTDATWNPLRGCSKVSAGCTNCYAEKVAARFSGPGMAYEGLATRSPARWTGKVRLIKKHLEDPLRWRRPRRIFVNSMSDLFHESVSDEDIARIFSIMWRSYPRHQFQVLTKRADRMHELLNRIETNRVTRFGRYAGTCLPDIPWLHQRAWQLANAADPSRFASKVSDWPLPNVWIGVSVENQATADERIPRLLDTPAAVRFISAEPLLEEINLDPPGCPNGHKEGEVIGSDGATGFCRECGTEMAHGWWMGDAERELDWVIVGGESGPGARPCKLAWIERVVTECQGAGVPVFVKQLGSKPEDEPPADTRSHGTDGRWRPMVDGRPMMNAKGADPSEWPESLRVQQWPA